VEQAPDLGDLVEDGAEAPGVRRRRPAGEVFVRRLEQRCEVPGRPLPLGDLGTAGSEEELCDEAVDVNARMEAAPAEPVLDLSADLVELGLVEVQLDGVDEARPASVFGVQPGEGAGDLPGVLLLAVFLLAVFLLAVFLLAALLLGVRLRQDHPQLGDDFVAPVGVVPGGDDVQISAAVRTGLLGRGGEDEAAVAAGPAQGGVGDGEGAQAVAHRPVADGEAALVVLDLLADGGAVAEKAVDVLVALDDEGFVVLQVEPAQNAEAGLVEVAADRRVSGALGAQEGRRRHGESY
jgi:hypothetical protein